MFFSRNYSPQRWRRRVYQQKCFSRMSISPTLRILSSEILFK